MILAFRRPCAAHRAALLDFVDRRQPSTATPSALDHLERCRACEAELGATALTISALRRMHDELARVEPPPDAWLRLRDRVTRRRDPWQWRATLGGLVTSAFLVSVLVLPVSIGAPATVGSGLGLEESAAGIRRESAYLASIGTGTLPPVTRAVARGGGSVPQGYPPEIATVRKEVPATPPPLRPAKPI